MENVFNMKLSKLWYFLLVYCLWHATNALANDVLYHWFEYEGKDTIFMPPLEKGQYQNPIIAGFYPDPSITRVDDTYYMVHSSFAYFPGVPLFASTDLVNWRSLGHILTRSSQVGSEKVGVSEGVFAPTLRYHNGTFYMITTAVASGGNFIVTAKDPQGPWSEPILLPEIDGIDPDIFFDDNGKVYITHNGPPEGEPLYNGHRAIWVWQYDPVTQKVLADSGRVVVNGGVDISQKPIWIEAPHIYKINDWYYLLCAEGGTGDWHSAVVFRSRSMDEAFVPYEKNPILTQRHQPADRENPISATGHADIVQTAAGEWWAVFLGTRNYSQSHFNTGRETFLLPVQWQDEWPIILPKGELLPYRLALPKGMKATLDADITTGNFRWRDDFSTQQLRNDWSLLRASRQQPYRLISGGGLTLEPRKVSLADRAQPAFVGRRQQHMRFNAATELQIPGDSKISAGITAFQNEKYHYFLALRRTEKNVEIFLEKAANSIPKTIAKAMISLGSSQAKTMVLGIEGEVDKLSFYYQLGEGDKKYLAKNKDATILSTSIAGGFVGVHLGMHARLNIIEPKAK